MSPRGRVAAVRRTRLSPPLLVPALVAAWAGLAAPAAGQILQGRVLDEDDERPVGYALVQLLDREGRVKAVATADTAGRYRIEAPEPGEYSVLTERIGYDPFRSLLFDLSDPDAVYPVDIGLRRVPMPVDGIVVTAERVDRVERTIQGVIGVSPASLRRKPVLRQEILSHARRGRNLRDLVRWSNAPGVVVREGPDGTCFSLPSRRALGGRLACLPVYLNEFPVPSWVTETVSLENLEAVVLLYPGESIRYERGAVLLYTGGFIR